MAGILFIVSAPSGAGKTTLVNELVKELDNIVVSISHTTRPKRSMEQDGQHYYFVDEKTFIVMRQQDEFIEYANVFGYYYGTSKRLIEQELQQQHDVVLVIDWQGARKVKEKFSEAVGIFILPPSIDILRERLISRGQDSLWGIEQRMVQAEVNMAHSKDYDYVMVNDCFEEALADLVAIVKINRVKKSGGFGDCAKFFGHS